MFKGLCSRNGQNAFKTVFFYGLIRQRLQQLVFCMESHPFAGMGNHTPISYDDAVFKLNIILFTGILQSVGFAISMTANTVRRSEELRRQPDLSRCYSVIVFEDIGLAEICANIMFYTVGDQRITIADNSNQIPALLQFSYYFPDVIYDFHAIHYLQ